MLQLVREYPNLNPRDLARLCGISERGVYRYLNTLTKVGFSIRFENGGYKLQGGYNDILARADPRDLEALRILLSEGMRSCEDQQIVERGRRFMELMDMNFPKGEERRLDEIRTVPKGIAAAHHGGTVSIGHSSKPDVINPILTSETISVDLMSLIFSSLVKFDADLQPVPDLARSWEVSEDGLVWTFFLRDDVKFHDGHPFTAHDAEFTYKSIVDPKNKSPMAERYRVIDRIEIEGNYVFRIVLKYPFAPLIHWLSREIAPKHLLEDMDLRDTRFNRYPVGSGPFRLTDWMEDDTIVLEANKEYYHRGRPILDRLVFKSYPDRRVALEAITRGEMDIALNLAASDLLFVSRSRSFRVYSAPCPSYYAIVFNLKNPFFRDIRIRKALDHAIDKESIIKNQLKGYSKISTGPFSVNSWAYDPDIKPVPYNVEKAKELLAQAGWRDTDGDGVLDRDGQPLEFSLTVPNISHSLHRIAVAIRAQLMKAGIKVELVYIDDSELYETTFQAILVMIITSADPDYAYRSWHSTGGNANLASYKNKLVDDLLELGRRTVELKKRKGIYHKIHRIINDDSPAIFMASGCEFIASNYRFRDSRFPSVMHFLNSMKDWQIIGAEEEGAVHERREQVK
jgi:peptide/nickel transport system substrate-binding protein